MRQTAAVWHWTLPEGSVLAVAFKDADRCFALKLIYYNIYYFCCQWSGRLHLGIYCRYTIDVRPKEDMKKRLNLLE